MPTEVPRSQETSSWDLCLGSYGGPGGGGRGQFLLGEVALYLSAADFQARPREMREKVSALHRVGQRKNLLPLEPWFLWLQRHPEAGLSWPSWPKASCLFCGYLGSEST